MHFRQQVKAGVLLYALLMAAIFSLLLQFYINRQISNYHIYETSQASTTAYAMANLTLDHLSTLPKDKAMQEGQLSLSTGTTHYKQKEQEIHIRVQLQTGQDFQYQFAIPSKKD